MMMAIRGRFAPSPTGRLHLGSLVTAVASYLDAKAAGGAWLVRMEDVDTTRAVPGAASAILRSLEAHGLEWDGPVMVQSERTEAYRAALELLRAHTYACGCSRRAFPGHCAGTCGPPYATRLSVTAEPIEFADRLTGTLRDSLPGTCGDFVLRRSDGLYTYQLAVVVDDIYQDITTVVRGADLLASTARQVYLYRLLQADRPRYLHVPLVCDTEGNKLSKQTFAPPLEDADASSSLWRALEFLLHPPPDPFYGAPPKELLRWALPAWNPLVLA